MGYPYFRKHPFWWFKSTPWQKLLAAMKNLRLRFFREARGEVELKERFWFIEPLERYCWWFRHPKQPPAVYKTLEIMGQASNLNWWVYRISEASTVWFWDTSKRRFHGYSIGPVRLMVFDGLYQRHLCQQVILWHSVGGALVDLQIKKMVQWLVVWSLAEITTRNLPGGHPPSKWWKLSKVLLFCMMFEKYMSHSLILCYFHCMCIYIIYIYTVYIYMYPHMFSFTTRICMITW